MKPFEYFTKKYFIEIIIVVLGLGFSSWLMFHTFSYADGNMLIASKAWSDFASHIPLIRSFSYGWNFPPEYPIFPGEPIKYHFLFYFFVGMLEKIGIRIDIALNLLSIIGFMSLLIMVYAVSAKLFKNRAVGILSVIGLLFNGSLSMLAFFSSHPLSKHSLQDIIHNTTFPSFGPYDGKIVSAFWNLNIYTNQRHLAASMALSLFILYQLVLLRKKQHLSVYVFLGVLFGMSFYFHTALFLMTFILLSYCVLVFSDARKGLIVTLLLAGMVAVPQYLYLHAASSNFPISFVPGYLIAQNLNLKTFFSYWILNLGIYFFLIPIAFTFASREVKKIFFGFFLFFIAGNLFQFTPDMGTNHKFFNYFMIGGIILSFSFLVSIWKKACTRAIIAVIIFFLIFSGIIDFFPIFNDRYLRLTDSAKNPDIQWLMKNTSPNSVFLNATYLFTPESMAGRKILFGWPYFSWGAGYDTQQRGVDRRDMLAATDKETFCKLAKKYKIQYVSLKKNESDDGTDNMINHVFFDDNFPLVYSNKETQVMIYSSNSCENFNGK